MLKTGDGSAIARTATTTRQHVRVNKGLIDALRFIVALLLLSHMLLKAQPLLEWVVQLRVRVAELLATHEALKTLTESWPRTVPLGQR